ncbi:MAG: PQQ-dependent sugar dehydrogenase [Pirellulales bacterium]
MAAFSDQINCWNSALTKAFRGVLCLLVSLVPYLPVTTAGAEDVDQSKLSIATERSFKNLSVRRPIVLTHAGDGTNRVFIASEHGVIHVLPNDQGVEKTTVFLDIEKKVTYKDKQNEEGFLGLAFHPDYKKNGQFFVYYSTKDAAQTSVISRFRVTSDDPNRADPASEEELMRIKQPFWNHNGGNILFGPDGCLYIGLGDGGSARDPKGNGQNRATLLGNILRIDVDRKDDGKKYAIPKDNPFVGMKDARPEIWACGFRNPWGMTFDAETGLFWVADVGQDIWEEVNIVQKGGNYGWNLREAKHKFGDKGSGPRDDLIDPIWEYDHKVGKSITGGRVYRGKRIKQLVGAYLYADYVSGKIWALRYDVNKKKVTANRPLRDNKMPIISFGEDQDGEVYLTDALGQIHRFVEAKK